MKWIILLAIFVIVEYEEIKGYPQYDNTEKNLRTIAEVPIMKVSENSYWMFLPRFQILPYLNQAYHNVFTYISKKLELLEANYRELAERLKKYIEGSKPDEKDKKDPSLPENIVSNNETQVDVIITTLTSNKSIDIPATDISMNTQKPTPAKNDNIQKSDDKKDPLHISETVSNNENVTPQENVTPTILEPVEFLTTQKPELIKNDEEEKPIKQDDKKTTLVPTEHNKDENNKDENNKKETTIVPPITDNEEIVSIKPTDQVEISTTKTDQTEKLTSDENEKSLKS
ncbi:uncharacterized protein LOC114933508 [Nylanderia fulva]|uniref:uncharacterized protein LOC114933508 n=1 Tax=Nylanderia fulva TaxID=613905 RepID=UPI0010FB11CB|nr:uncharacterized protein LOC114933508 [Nylanderia fulva]